jgi:hypothetical protein
MLAFGLCIPTVVDDVVNTAPGAPRAQVLVLVVDFVLDAVVGETESVKSMML